MSFCQKYFGLKRLCDTFGYTCSGLRECLTEVAFKQELFVGLVHFVAVSVLDIPMMPKLFLSVLWIVWICVEILNTAIETVVDLVSPQWNPLAKRAKDLASAAVFCMIVVFFGSWTTVIAGFYLYK